jgi:hypothetical protein
MYLICVNTGETEMLQPIDSGIGSILKTIMGQVQDEWLDIEDNLLAWEGDPNALTKLDARARRILITKWAGEAWEKLTTAPEYKDTIFKCFLRTGALITSDFSDDDKICPLAGLKVYKIPIFVVDNANSSMEHRDGVHAQDVTMIESSTTLHQLEEEQSRIITASNANEDDSEDIDDDEYLIIQNCSGDEDFHQNCSLVIENEEAHDHEDIEANDNEDEQQSWYDSVTQAANLSIPWEVSDVSCNYEDSRLLPAYALLFRNKEWDLVKIEKQNSDKTFRYKVDSTWNYGQHTLASADHGRNNISKNRWVSLRKISHRK